MKHKILKSEIKRLSIISWWLKHSVLDGGMHRKLAETSLCLSWLYSVYRPDNHINTIYKTFTLLNASKNTTLNRYIKLIEHVIENNSNYPFKIESGYDILPSVYYLTNMYDNNRTIGTANGKR